MTDDYVGAVLFCMTNNPLTVLTLSNINTNSVTVIEKTEEQLIVLGVVRLPQIRVYNGKKTQKIIGVKAVRKYLNQHVKPSDS